jgi:glycine/D-amino acid oxidase-like deaminating enzyme
MYQSSDKRGDSPVTIIGAGVAGAWQALLFAQAGHAVTLHERSDAAMTLSTSHWAGGMLAPWCEAETSEPVISRLGIRALDLWREHFPKTAFNGSLVVAHPRWPLYVIPRGDGRFMLGATSIEAEDSGVSVRSALELLGAAYAVHPAFAEARIVEFGSGLRPAYPDNLPRIAIDHERISVNGLYRHGFLLAPALAELTLGYVERGVIDNEVMQCA